MIKTKVDFLEGRLLSIQSERLKKYWKSSDRLEKSRPSKKATFVLSCKQANSESFTYFFSRRHAKWLPKRPAQKRALLSGLT